MSECCCNYLCDSKLFIVQCLIDQCLQMSWHGCVYDFVNEGIGVLAILVLKEWCLVISGEEGYVYVSFLVVTTCGSGVVTIAVSVNYHRLG